MEERVITRTVEWIRDNVPEHTSKQELVEKVRGADIPDEGREAILELPDEDYGKDEVMALVRDDLIGMIGSASRSMRGFGGSM